MGKRYGKQHKIGRVISYILLVLFLLGLFGFTLTLLRKLEQTPGNDTEVEEIATDCENIYFGG